MSLCVCVRSRCLIVLCVCLRPVALYTHGILPRRCRNARLWCKLLPQANGGLEEPAQAVAGEERMDATKHGHSIMIIRDHHHARTRPANVPDTPPPTRLTRWVLARGAQSS